LGTRLTSEDVRLTSWPRGAGIEGSFQKISDVIDRGAIVTMTANEPVLETKLAGKDAGAGLQVAIKNGMRAISLRVNEVVGVAGFVIPGTHVDVILSGSAGGTEGEISKIILENVEVLAAGKNIARDAEGKPMDVQVVTLLVSPEDSQRVALASSDKIQLALRNPLDNTVVQPQAVSRTRLYSGAGPAPAVVETPPPPPPAPRKAVVAKSAPAPAPVPVPVPVQVAPDPPKPAVLEVQLIQGMKSEKLVFEQKSK